MGCEGSGPLREAVLQSLKRLAALPPLRQQQALKRVWWAREISRGRFSADEREFDRLDEWVKAGDVRAADLQWSGCGVRTQAKTAPADCSTTFTSLQAEGACIS